MEYKKSNSETLSEIYRNTQLALESISDILPEIEDENIKEEIMRQHEEYEKICATATMIAKNNGQELKEPNPIKKAMMWSGIKMNTIADKSASHIADMMVQGTVMGITVLRTTASELPVDGNDKIMQLLNEFIQVEEDLEKKWKEYL